MAKMICLFADETVKTIINIAHNGSENRNVTRRITKDIKNRLTWNKLWVKNKNSLDGLNGQLKYRKKSMKLKIY